jgi:micrococcal nuclease
LLCARAEAFCIASDAAQPATVVKVVDGDTLDVVVNGGEERVRVFGIDTPERGERCFSEASDRLAQLSASRIGMRADVRERDRNGRLLRYVYTNDGVSIDALLIAEGLARAWTEDGALRDALVALETETRAAERGCLWGG